MTTKKHPGKTPAESINKLTKSISKSMDQLKKDLKDFDKLSKRLEKSSGKKIFTTKQRENLNSLFKK